MLNRGFPEVQPFQQASTPEVEQRAQDLALGLSACVLRGDVGAFDALVAELERLNEFGEGPKVAVGALADVANDGRVGHVAAGHAIAVDPALLALPWVRGRLELWEKAAPDDSPGLDAPGRWDDALTIASLALTGRATAFLPPYAEALHRFGKAGPHLRRDALLILAILVAQRIEKFADWSGVSHDVLDDYRRQHPAEGDGQPG